MGAGWEITDHACRACLGRILTRKRDDGVLESRCSECGLHAEGGHRKLCACGVKLRTGKNAGLRCVRNSDVRPEAPAEIIVVHQDEEVSSG